jgi:hypothetical protein
MWRLAGQALSVHGSMSYSLRRLAKLVDSSDPAIHCHDRTGIGVRI